MIQDSYLLFLLIVWCFVAPAVCSLKEAYYWRTLKFDLPSEEDGDAFKALGRFDPLYSLPYSIDVYKDRLYMTILNVAGPAVPVSLAYINLNDSTKSPKLHPYPNLQAYKGSEDKPAEILDAFKIRVDKCDRLWVLDIDESDINALMVRFIVYDLKTDTPLREPIVLPSEHFTNETLISNMAVEDTDCENTYVYVGDLATSAMIVYSWKSGRSWRLTHEFFQPDEAVGKISIDGMNYYIPDGLSGLALSKNESGGFSTLFFHPWSSSHEFSISTKYLRNESFVKSKDVGIVFKNLGSRDSGHMPQAGAAFIDQPTKVMFYVTINSVSCWKTTTEHLPKSQGVVQKTRTRLHAMDIKIDANGTVWVLSTPFFLKVTAESLNPRVVNMIIRKATVPEAINGTVCDTKSTASSMKTTSYNIGIVCSILFIFYHF